jgi:hypothetical protein
MERTERTAPGSSDLPSDRQLKAALDFAARTAEPDTIASRRSREAMPMLDKEALL